MNLIFKILLKIKYRKHIETKHNVEDCPFCYMTPTDSDKFMKHIDLGDL